MSIKKRLEEIIATLPESVTLVAVSKTHPVEVIREAYDAGQRHFGESRPIELRDKSAELPKDIRWHMIGHLQTNKVKYVVPVVSLIHSIDSVRLVEAVNREAKKCDKTIEVLLQIHIAQEQSKTGWEIDELLAFLRSAPFAQMQHIKVRGVMGIATYTDDKEVVRAEFAELRRCFELLHPFFGARFDAISMGMSDDYAMAIDEGSTMVRIGSTIFGER